MMQISVYFYQMSTQHGIQKGTRLKVLKDILLLSLRCDVRRQNTKKNPL